MQIISKVACFVLIIGVSLAAELPSDIQKCKAEDVDCVTKITTEILHKNPKGRPDIGIPPIDPFKITSMEISRGNSGPIDLNLSFHNVDISGLSKITVIKAAGFTADPKTSKYELLAQTPKLHIKGKYKASGRILVLPIQGEGNSEISLEDVEIAVKFKPAVSEKNGKQYLAVDKLKMLLTPKKFSIRLENLFNGDRALGENMNAFINENWRDVWTELSPSINTAIAEVVKALMKNLFVKFSYDELVNIE